MRDTSDRGKHITNINSCIFDKQDMKIWDEIIKGDSGLNSAALVRMRKENTAVGKAVRPLCQELFLHLKNSIIREKMFI